jgi:hypothetical protein
LDLALSRSDFENWTFFDFDRRLSLLLSSLRPRLLLLLRLLSRLALRSSLRLLLRPFFRWLLLPLRWEDWPLDLGLSSLLLLSTLLSLQCLKWRECLLVVFLDCCWDDCWDELLECWDDFFLDFCLDFLLEPFDCL